MQCECGDALEVHIGKGVRKCIGMHERHDVGCGVHEWLA